MFFFFSSRRRHTRLQGDWSSDVCSSDLGHGAAHAGAARHAALRELAGHARRAHSLVHRHARLRRTRPPELGTPGPDTPALEGPPRGQGHPQPADRKSTRLNSSHLVISYAVFCLKQTVSYRSSRDRRSIPSHHWSEPPRRTPLFDCSLISGPCGRDHPSRRPTFSSRPGDEASPSL